jgi:hypothetical protein
MAAIKVETAPVCEPVSLDEAKAFLRVTSTSEDDLITELITAAREWCEEYCRRSFINKGYVQYLDSFPYYTDTIMSQQAYPPQYYSQPRYSTTLWNYSQMMKLFYSKLAKVSKITYIGSDQQPHDLLPSTEGQFDQDFVIDTASEPPRIFPLPGQTWPPVLYVPNAVAIHFVAGYNDEAAIKAAMDAYVAQSPVPTQPQKDNKEAGLRQADVPRSIKVAIKQLLAHYYENREAVSALTMKTVPKTVENLLSMYRVWDLAPTRG